MHFDMIGKRIFVTGHRGMVETDIFRRLAAEQQGVINKLAKDRLSAAPRLI
jgi:hypothetical protein